jgi:hypothetical protein
MTTRYATDNNKAIRDDKVKSEWNKVRDHLKITDEELTMLAEEIVEWAKQDSVIKAGMFVVGKDIAFEQWREWCEKSPTLKAAYEQAKYIIGERRERKALDGTYDASIVTKTMALYDAEYREWRREEASMGKVDAARGNQTITVHYAKFPETDEVKPKSYEGAE